METRSHAAAKIGHQACNGWAHNGRWHIWRLKAPKSYRRGVARHDQPEQNRESKKRPFHKTSCVQRRQFAQIRSAQSRSKGSNSPHPTMAAGPRFLFRALALRTFQNSLEKPAPRSIHSPQCLPSATFATYSLAGTTRRCIMQSLFAV